MNIKRILVPVDFSPPSTLAVNCAIEFARQFRAKLLLLHVVESPSVLLHPFAREARMIEAQLQEQAERMLPVFVATEDQDDLDVAFIVRKGEVAEVIEGVVHEEGADLVVMGAHGRNLFGQFFLGSMTQALLRKLGVPVATVCHVSRPLEFKRILYATDFGTGSDRGFRFALDMAIATKSSLLVAHSIAEKSVGGFETPELAERMAEARHETKNEAHQRFAEFEREATRKNVRIECVLDEGEAPETLVRIAEKSDVDIIILGLRKRGVMERAILGSTAEPLVRIARVPVLSVPIDASKVSEQHSAAAPAHHGGRT